MRKRIAKWGGVSMLVVALLVGALIGAAQWSWASRAGARYSPPSHGFAVPALTEENRAEAERLYNSRGCADCHGEDGAGRVMTDAPPMRLAAPNLTHVMRDRSPEELHSLIRRGVRPDGSPVLFMPAHDYAAMPDEELGLITAHVRALPPSDASQPSTEFHTLGRLLIFLGAMDTPPFPAELIDQDDSFEPVTDENLGEYIAASCRGCHGPNLSGGPIPGAPEEELGIPANITPHASGLEGWSLEDFRLALREGQTPDGPLDTRTMPVRVTQHFSDPEIDALWAYLQTVEPRPFGER